jgi:hypothetical protein
MSRKAGTPNKPKVEIPTGYKDDKFEVKQEKNIADEFKGLLEYPYSVLEAKSRKLLEDLVTWAMDSGYVCQGGVSVTNYRADNGSITMVYCQAMIRKD